MYINLGKINLNYITQSNDFLIFSEIINSNISFESPVLVKSIQELDIWFGKKFNNRNYLEYLLNQGITLYLYRPILEESNLDNYIDLDNYSIDSSYLNYESLPICGGIKYYINSIGMYYIWYNEQWTNTIDLPKLIDTTNYKIDTTYSNLEDLPICGGIKYYIKSTNTYYIWIEDQWVNIDYLPQNIENKSKSLNNRDTILITKSTYNGPTYSHPEYKEGETELGIFTHKPYEGLDNIDLSKLNSDKLSSGEETLAFLYQTNSISLKEGYLLEIDPNNKERYLLNKGNLFNIDKSTFEISDTIFETLDELLKLDPSISLYKNKLFYVKDMECYYWSYTDKTGKSSWESDRLIISNSYYNNSSNITTLNDIKTINKKKNLYKVEEIEKNKKLILYNSLPTKSLISHINTFRDLQIDLDFDTTQNILTQLIQKEKGIEMWSKTIGKDINNYDDSSLIKVLIEKSDDELYRFTISKYDYEEIFEGYLFSTSDNITERLDYIISKNSKLINCKFYNLKNRLTNKTYYYIPNLENNSDTVIFTTNDFSFEPKVKDKPLTIFVKSTNTKYQYSVEISKDGNTEVFTGNIFDNSLVKQINNTSTFVNNFELLGLCKDLRLGEFYLKRAKVEDCNNRKNYLRSLKEIFNDNNDPIKFEYFLIPNIYNYIDIINLDKDYNYYKEYLTFLDYAKKYDCQFLIQNNKIQEVDKLPNNPLSYCIYKINNDFYIFDENWKLLDKTTTLLNIYNLKGDFIYNYIKDSENRLVYFYQPIKLNDVEMPGYYLYINGLLLDSYSIKSNQFIYDVPISDPYTSSELIEQDLENYKSNFLVCNNQEYYYKKYFNGIDYLTTGWMRFALNKINIELIKNKGYYLSKKNPLRIQKNIETILDSIKSYFSIIKRIDITDFSIDLHNNSLSLTISTYVNDLVNNNISLDITINYKTE